MWNNVKSYVKRDVSLLYVETDLNEASESKHVADTHAHSSYLMSPLFSPQGGGGPPGPRGVVGPEGQEGVPGVDGVPGKDGSKGMPVRLLH